VKAESGKWGTTPLVQTHPCSLVQHDTKTKVKKKIDFSASIEFVIYNDTWMQQIAVAGKHVFLFMSKGMKTLKSQSWRLPHFVIIS